MMGKRVNNHSCSSEAFSHNGHDDKTTPETRMPLQLGNHTLPATMRTHIFKLHVHGNDVLYVP